MLLKSNWTYSFFKNFIAILQKATKSATLINDPKDFANNMLLRIKINSRNEKS